MNPQGSIVCSIPRLINVIWIGNSVPDRVLSLVETCRGLNPDFEVRLWRDADLTWLTNQDSFSTEPRVSGKANIARYEILRRFGGIYLDADFELLGALDSVTALGALTGFVVARESRVVFNNAFMASCPGHPLIEMLVEGVPESMRRNAATGSPARTGPLYLTEMLLNFVATGGAVTELPTGWVYPYFYDRPDLTKSAVSSETLLRHEWASTTDKWGGGSRPAARSLTIPALRERGRALAREVRPAAVRARLSALPESHLARDGGYAAAYRLASWPWLPSKRTGSELPAPDAVGDVSLPAAVRFGVLRTVLRKTRGSATYVEVGLPTEEFWRIASRRLDRPGHAISVADTHRTALPPEQLGHVPTGRHVATQDEQTGSSIRCSRALLLASKPAATGGDTILTNGTPLRPRTLDASRSLHRWDNDDEAWTLEWLLESRPHIDLLLLGFTTDLATITPVLERMATERRVDTLIILADPNSTTRPPSQIHETLRALHTHIRSTRTPGTTPKRGVTNWKGQIRTAQQPIAIQIEFVEHLGERILDEGRGAVAATVQARSQQKQVHARQPLSPSDR